MLLWQPNKMATGHKTHINWVDNHQMIHNCQYDSHHFISYRENAM